MDYILSVKQEKSEIQTFCKFSKIMAVFWKISTTTDTLLLTKNRHSVLKNKENFSLLPIKAFHGLSRVLAIPLRLTVCFKQVDHFQSMEYGGRGLPTALVVLHVVREQRKELDAAIIQHQHMEAPIVLDETIRTLTVTLVHVESMEFGGPGLPTALAV